MENKRETEKPVTITFGNIHEVNIVIAGLDEIPHKFSRPIIDAIEKQTKEQIPGVSFSRPQL